MAAPTVYEGVSDDAEIRGQLFAGKKFFIAQRVISRPRYIDLVKSNGGEVVLLEKQADYLIANHHRSDCPPGSISCTFIDKSIERGELQDPEDHPAGPPTGTVRESGSLSRPVKGTRDAFTQQEDTLLYKWVRDQVNAGGLANGNEIYKALEKRKPRHTWQSWRDRYVKRLQYMLPSAFNIPDNAPPSPPSDTPAEPAPTPVRTHPKKQSASKPDASTTKASSSDRVDSVDYTVEELTTEGLFDKRDWEHLYAFADDIDAASGEEYQKGWHGWAKDRHQTARQWRQYFEKVVRPQWRQDPVEKHEEIKRRVEERMAEEREDSPEQDESRAGPSTPTSKPPNKRKRDDAEDNRFESFLNDRHKGKASSAYVLFARENKWQVWNEEEPGLDYTGLHELLMSRWNALSSEEKAPYIARAAAEHPNPTNNTVTLSSQVFLSSSTVVNETPTYITEAYKKALNQLRVIVEPSVDGRDGTPPPTKRRKSVSPELGSHTHPLKISSAGSDLDESAQDEETKNRPAGQGLEDITTSGQNVDNNGSASPTPRAPRYKAAFDTQAILSSPSQGASLGPIPPPLDLKQLRDRSREQDDSDKLDSDASQHTTESLEEFSQLIQENPRGSSLAPLSRPLESPALSSPSSTDSGDPDPPLALDEVDEYFEEQRSLGFSNDHIAEALKHTRWRPELASEVLEAWAKEEPLPTKRGIWSDEDDEDVEGGDGMALARLERLHTIDGWGGITERLNFLTKYRDAKMS
ncbi:hypothetical protein BU23DRAFT_454992 [Bimuria novae-zelandiae CBS 107.79]|uniref:DNA-binding protein RAP1 n=1 Tax=Bimuria novae-zelandiae CBS 107.79 TaxID=1447943 RepID=A0A6A5VPU3_9PLEO|nr:hypothetical protein BU23DRAFT_454992 [Bimuria novae-zelandiae CBS 107.79]